jgi:glucose/arabinose dehydrogenase
MSTSRAMLWFALHDTRRGVRARVRFRPTPERLEERWMLTTLPPNFAQTLVATGLTAPTAMDFAPDGRLFVAEQRGALRVIENGTLLATPFLSLNVDSSGERGLLGVAFDPNFATDHYVYVYYTTRTAPVHNRVSRFTANGNAAIPGSEVNILDLNNLSNATNHNGGGIHFGPDGKLYIGVGENANPANSQTLNNLLGKMLRITPDGSIPTDNPFYNTATGINRAIWATGLRNPFTFAFQPGTGRMFINDVGQNAWEEIDDGIAGSNYGWSATEGPTNAPGFRGPLFAYGHGNGDTLGSAIVGGTFYNPPTNQFPSNYVGTYFFEDLTNGWIRNFDPRTGTVSGFATGIPSPLVDLKVDSSGNLYYLAQSDSTQGNAGSVYRINYTSPQATPNLDLFRPANADWISLRTSGGTQTRQFGSPVGDIPIRGDFDGDGISDLAVYRPSTAQWFILSSTGGGRGISFGQPNVDVPLPADFDGDGKTDIAVYRPPTGEWFILQSSAGPRYRQFGQALSDMPVPADYDGDHKADLAVYRPSTSTWFILQSSAGPRAQVLGGGNQDIPVPADFDNDGRTDLAVYRSSTATWTVQQSTAGLRVQQFGQPGSDIPVPADFDGDGKTDLGVYRSSTGTWYLLQSTVGSQAYAFGQPNVDVPLNPPLAYRWRGSLGRAVSVRADRAPTSPYDSGPLVVIASVPSDSELSDSTASEPARPHRRRVPSSLVTDQG